MSVEGGPNIVEEGLVFYLDAINPRSYISGSVPEVTYSLVGDITGSLINDVSGSLGEKGSWEFDGIDDAILVSSSLGLVGGGSPFSISWWFKPTLTSGIGTITGWSATKRMLVYSVNGYVSWNHGNYKFFTSSIGSTPMNEWSHVTYVFDYTTHYFYINGELNNSAAPLDSINWNEPFYIGQYESSFSFYDMKGYITSFQAYNKALTSQEIQQNYNALKHRFT